MRNLTMPQNAGIGLSPLESLKTVRKRNLPIVLMIMHAPLGLLLYNSSSLGVVHAYSAVLLGLYFALRKDKRLGQVAAVVAYLLGAEVLWRMAQVPVFWEFGKYAAALIMIVALLQRNFHRIPVLPALFFAFLLPACFFAFRDNSFEAAKSQVSFNMSGPLLLFVSCWFFAHVRIGWDQIRNVLFWLIVPLFSVGITTLFYTVTIENIQFTTESNFATSGGFGPNQVSAMLGLGAFVSAACYLLFKNKFREKIWFGLLTLFFTAQCVLTFSRGGVFNAVGAVSILVLFQMRDLKEGVRRIVSVALIGGIFLVLIFPYLNAFTGGVLKERFEETEPSSRVEIMDADYRIFLENPVFGVGIGKAYEYREKFLNRKAVSHTEFTRIVSEHGLLGVLSLLALFAGLFLAVKRKKLNASRAFAAGCIVWGVLFMTNAGMRLAAPAFVLGLSFMTTIVWKLPFSRLPKRSGRRRRRPPAPEGFRKTAARVLKTHE